MKDFEEKDIQMNRVNAIMEKGMIGYMIVSGYRQTTGEGGIDMEYTIIEGNYAKIGVSRTAEAVYFTFEGEKEQKCAILLYAVNGRQIRIPVPDAYCVGALRSVGIKGLNWKKYDYNYEIDGTLTFDRHARKIIGREKWADPARLTRECRVRAGFDFADFDWQGDRFPEIPRERMFMYKLNVRSFTMDAGAVGRRKGTFAGVMDKIPYLKELGVTSLELMPVYEFEELMPVESDQQDVEDWSENAKEGLSLEKKTNAQSYKVNCWGYIPGDYYGPKASYSSEGEPSVELKTLIRELHKNHMECILEMYFDETMNQNIAVEILRYWVMEYHVDGFHLLGASLPVDAMAQDLILRRTKLFATGFHAHLMKQTAYPHLFVYNDDYLFAVRHLLSRVDGSIPELLNQLRRQNRIIGFVNYVAGNNGFTLADLFSYVQKHNEANGEGNRDGIEWNFSCNGGMEGPTRKRNILEYRRRQMRNAIVLVMIGQGVPLLLAGDEFGNSQQGNNNCYCQDNKTGWVNWSSLKKNQAYAKFVRQMAAFRRQHPVLSSNEPMQMCDYDSRGCPDLSYHGESAWIMAPNQYPQAIGILYCGAYAVCEDGTPDDYIYIGLNFSITKQSLALPNLPRKLKWHLVVNTSDKQQPFYSAPLELEEKTRIEIPLQSILILTGN